MRPCLASSVLLASVVGIVMPLRAETMVVLDSFLGGLLSDCQGSKSFDQFRISVAARHGHDGDGKRTAPDTPIAAPPDVKQAMGSIIAENKGEYTEAVVPLSGTFRSLRVSGIEFAFGNQSGIEVTIVRFAASKREVAKVLGRDVARASRLIRRRVRAGETGADQSVTLDEEGGRARLVCDISN